MNHSSTHSLAPASDKTSLALGFTGSLGNLDAYISAVNRLPMLTHEEEMRLATDLREKNDLAAAQQMVMSHLVCVWYPTPCTGSRPKCMNIF